MVKKAEKFFENLYKLYIACDCTIAEINPLVTTTDGNVLALDAKLNFDDNALFKHPEIEAYRDSNEESKLEMEAHEFGLSYMVTSGVW